MSRNLVDKSCGKTSHVMRSHSPTIIETGVDLMSSSAKGRVFWPGPKLQQLNTENFESRILQYLVSTLQ